MSVNVQKIHGLLKFDLRSSVEAPNALATYANAICYISISSDRHLKIGSSRALIYGSMMAINRDQCGIRYSHNGNANEGAAPESVGKRIGME
jgi:hypothetical protein